MPFTPPTLLPPNEPKRLATLQTYGILHSLREPLFAELVELAATLFGVPISLIALVGADEVEYIATHGLPGLRAQPRAEAVCSMAVRQQRAIVFSDLADVGALTAEAEANARMQNLRFYAGAPLCMAGRQCIGTFCIIDRQPRTFSAPELLVLEQLAHLASQLIAVRHYCTINPTKELEYWSLIRNELAREIHALLAHVRQLLKHSNTHVPVAAGVLEATHGCLHELCWRLTDYYPGALFS